MKLSIQQVVKDESSLVLFKVRLKTLAKKLGFDSITIENMQIVASEMLSNQVKYSNKTGMVQLWFHGERVSGNESYKKGKAVSSSPVTIDIFAMDYGPGIKDVKKAYKDGFTTSKTMGKGLGSISRMAHESALFTLTTDALSDKNAWHGVACWGRFYRSEKEKPANYQYGLFCRAYHDMAQNGDDLWLNLDAKKMSCLHIDATGHGPEAEKIVQKVKTIKADILSKNVEKILDMTQRALVTTAGAAVVALKYNAELSQGEYCAVGDMRLFRIEASSSNKLNHSQLNELAVCSGILGRASRSYSRQEFTLNSDELILSASDGIRRNWKLEDFPGLWEQHPQLICFFLGNKKGRSSDDQSIIALKKISVKERKSE